MKFKVSYEIDAPDMAAAHEWAYTILAVAGKDAEKVEVTRAASTGGLTYTEVTDWVPEATEPNSIATGLRLDDSAIFNPTLPLGRQLGVAMPSVALYANLNNAIVDNGWHPHITVT